MPLAVRYVEPKYLCRRPLPDGVKNELHAVAAFSLVGAIRQIGSLARHAESLMGELCDAAADCTRRALALQERVDHLKRKVVPRLDVQEDADIETEIHLIQEPFKSDNHISQQLLSIKTAPESLMEQYKSSEKIPPFYQFTPDWEDGRNAMHMYSNPEYFFNSWRADMERKADVISSKRRSATNADSVMEESTEVTQSKAIKPNKKNSKGSNDMSYSATLPIRVKGRQRSRPQMAHAFDSVKRTRMKERAALPDDGFINTTSNSSNHITTTSNNSSNQTATTTTPAQENSESSGYMSQHSSYQSLVEQDNTGTAAIHQSTSSLTETVDHHSDEAPSKPRPQVLNRTRSSVSSNQSKRESVAKRSGVPSSSASPTDSTPTSAKNSPRRESLPVHLHVTQVPTLPLEVTRKESLPVKMAPPFISPSASPKIRHRAISMGQSLLESSPNRISRNSGVFSFPDPIEILRSNPYLNISNFSLDEILSTDDLSSSRSDLLLPTRRTSSNVSPPTPRRPAPNPPVGSGGNSPRRHQSVSSNASPETARSARPRSYYSRQELGSTGNSPVLLRRTSQESSPSIPKRKAPPPPLTQETVEAAAKSSPRRERSIDKPHPLKQPQQEIKTTENSARSDPPKRQLSKETSKKKLTQQSSTEKGDTGQANGPLASTVVKRQRNNSTEGRPMVVTKEGSLHDNQVKESSRHGSQEDDHHGDQPAASSHTPKSKSRGFFNRQSSQEKEMQKSNRKSANQILKASGVDTGISSERTKLLSSIRKGIELKRVQQRQEQEETMKTNKKRVVMPWDVAAILERRQALENSDNELDDGVVQDAEWEEL